jgi:hypothetical protein
MKIPSKAGRTAASFVAAVMEVSFFGNRDAIYPTVEARRQQQCPTAPANVSDRCRKGPAFRDLPIFAAMHNRWAYAHTMCSNLIQEQPRRLYCFFFNTLK